MDDLLLINKTALSQVTELSILKDSSGVHLVKGTLWSYFLSLRTEPGQTYLFLDSKNRALICVSVVGTELVKVDCLYLPYENDRR